MVRITYKVRDLNPGEMMGDEQEAQLLPEAFPVEFFKFNAEKFRSLGYDPVTITLEARMIADCCIHKAKGGDPMACKGKAPCGGKGKGGKKGC